MEHITREEAYDLLKKYNKDPFHIQHALTVETVMKWYAEELGFGADAEYWGIVGLLHDIDFELYPEEHCIKSQEIMKERGIFARGWSRRRHHTWRGFTWLWNYRGCCSGA